MKKLIKFLPQVSSKVFMQYRDGDIILSELFKMAFQGDIKIKTKE